jgi:hypothetical protein
MVMLEVSDLSSSKVLHAVVSMAALPEGVPVELPLFHSLQMLQQGPTLTICRKPWTPLTRKKVVTSQFFFIFFLAVVNPLPPSLEIHHQPQAVEALHAPLRLRDRWCLPSLLGVRPSP